MDPTLAALWREARRLRRIGRPGNRPPRMLPRLFLFTDPARTPDPVAATLGLPRGAAVVYRAFGAPDALEKGRAIAQAARRRGVIFMVGADVALAVALRADGIHWPERLAFRPGINRRLARRFLLTGAAHRLPAILRARGARLAAVVVSPVFPSRSPSAGAPLGGRRLAVWTRAARIPVMALGGVNASTARRAGHAGAAALAGVEGVTARSG
jgi:thiamine-phosphate pyrophosphorylase